MKYYPIHKAMIPFLAVGMVVIIKKRWTIKDTKPLLATCSKSALFLDEDDLAKMYISKTDILAMKTFKGAAFIKKYHAYGVTNPHVDNLPTHLELKAKLANATLLYLPINCLNTTLRLPVGTRIVHNGGNANNMQGKVGKIAALRNYSHHQSNFDKGIEVAYVDSDYFNSYSIEWFTKHIYVCVDDLKHLVPTYVARSMKHAVTSSKLQDKQPKAFTASELEKRVSALLHNREGISIFSLPWRQCGAAERLEAAHTKAAHSFDRTAEPTKWLALGESADTLVDLEAATEPGLKAKIALEFAKDSNLTFEVYAKVGEATAQTLTEKVLRFFNK